MALKTIIENIQKAREAYEAALSEASEGLQESIAEFLADALSKAPEQYVAIRWSQYTPYFNDGEPCTFSVRDPFCITEDQEDERWEGAWYYDWDKETEHAALKVMSDAWDTLDEDVLKQAFGDHVQITVRRDGSFEVDERDHD